MELIAKEKVMKALAKAKAAYQTETAKLKKDEEDLAVQIVNQLTFDLENQIASLRPASKMRIRYNLSKEDQERFNLKDSWMGLEVAEGSFSVHDAVGVKHIGTKHRVINNVANLCIAYDIPLCLDTIELLKDSPSEPARYKHFLAVDLT